MALAAIDSDRKALVKLRELLTAYLSIDDLRTLCFDLGIEYENLPDTIGGMAREVVRLCERQGRIRELVEAFKRLRPTAFAEEEPSPARETQREQLEIVVIIHLDNESRLPGSVNGALSIDHQPEQIRLDWYPASARSCPAKVVTTTMAASSQRTGYIDCVIR